MATDTNIKTLIINKMTQAQYDALTSKSASEVYVITDAATAAPTALDAGVEVGLRGDYCSTYGVVGADYGIPTRGTKQNTINIPGGMVLNMPATTAKPDDDGLVTMGTSYVHDMMSTKTCYLFYVHGLDDLLECEQMCFMKTKPGESSATCRVWFDGTQWYFRDINYGDTWIPCRGQPLAKCIFKNGVLTRLDYTGWYNIPPKVA